MLVICNIQTNFQLIFLLMRKTFLWSTGSLIWSLIVLALNVVSFVLCLRIWMPLYFNSDKEQLFVSKIRQGRAAQYFPWTKPSQSPCGPHSGATEEKAVFVSCSCFPLSLLLQTMMCIKLIVSIICRKMWRCWSKASPCEVSVDYQVRQVPANLLCRGAAPPSQEPLVFSFSVPQYSNWKSAFVSYFTCVSCSKA